MLPKMKKRNPMVIHFFIHKCKKNVCCEKMFGPQGWFLISSSKTREITMDYTSFFIVLDCQNRIISEINTNTCITFTQPNSTDAMYIKRYIHSLCVFINGEIFARPSAWNRTFVCDKHDSTLSMCFSNTMTSDAGVFNLIVGSVQRNTTTREVECR